MLEVWRALAVVLIADIQTLECAKNASVTIELQ